MIRTATLIKKRVKVFLNAYNPRVGYDILETVGQLWRLDGYLIVVHHPIKRTTDGELLVTDKKKFVASCVRSGALVVPGPYAQNNTAKTVVLAGENIERCESQRRVGDAQLSLIFDIAERNAARTGFEANNHLIKEYGGSEYAVNKQG